MEPLVLFLIGAAILVAIVIVLNRVLAGYRMAKDSFDVLLFGRLPIVRIRYVDIVGAEVVPMRHFLFHANPFRTVGLGNRMFVRHFVDIQRKGWLNHVMVTPPHPEAFVRELKQRAAAAKAADAAGQ